MFRSNAPNAKAVMPATVTYNAASDSDALSWFAEQCLAHRERGKLAASKHGEEHHDCEHRHSPPQHGRPAVTTVKDDRIPVLW